MKRISMGSGSMGWWPRLVAGLVLAAALVPLGLPAADNVRIRLATLAPKDTTFHKSLLTMGEKWREASAGKVALTVFTDGTMGGEADMVRRMRIGQIQAAMLTVGGLNQIDPSAGALQVMPLKFRTLEELDFVREKLRPTLEQRFLEKGFVVLFWSDAGWVQFFSKKPAATSDDFKKLKTFVWAGDANAIELMKSTGFNAVPLEFTDSLTGLQTGLLEAIPTLPLYALTGQFYGPAPHLLRLNWVPLVGATVVTKKVWDSVPAAARAAMLKAAQEAGEQIKRGGRQENEEAIAAMAKRGLQVHEATPEIRADWLKFMEPVYPRIRGKLVPADLFDEVNRLLEEYRAAGGKPTP